MPNRLHDAVSPYLRSHASNPVEWWPWSAEAFAEAAERDVPVMISIGYSTCHWCHVMARESFSDPAVAAELSRGFVAIKVDREEHPDVDATYLAAAGAFTEQLGWPLTVFATPQGAAFYAGTYFAPQPVGDRASFRQVLDAVADAWTNRRTEVEGNAAAIVVALREQTAMATDAESRSTLPGDIEFETIVGELLDHEDTRFGGFGGAPKFPSATVMSFLLDRASLGDHRARALAERTLASMAASELRDAVEGGFFRYSTRRDWSEPHYERMLYDNAQLLEAYSRVGDEATAVGIVGFLESTMLLASGGFASAQDSESTVDGVRVEGGYYALDATARRDQTPPALDAKRLAGWNGLAIRALATAGTLLGRPGWVSLAVDAADAVLRDHLRPDGSLVRASIAGRVSAAHATLEDYGMFADALLTLAMATGEVRFAEVGRALVDGVLGASGDSGAGGTSGAGALPFAVRGGADPVLVAHGLALKVDPSEGAYPSGLSAMASACAQLALLTGDSRYEIAARRAMEVVAGLAVGHPMAFGAALSVMTGLAAEGQQLVVVSDAESSALASVARGWSRSGAAAVVVTTDQCAAFAAAGFELFEGRVAQRGEPTAYLCHDFVCDLPTTDATALAASLATSRATPEIDPA